MSSRAGQVAVALLVVLLGLLASGCGGTAAPAATGPKSAPPTPVEQLNAAALTLARLDFCTLIPVAAVRDALGGKSSTQRETWRNGEPTEVGAGRRDVVHEFGCSWARDGYSARAWVFARSVSKAFAQTVLDKTGRRPGCTASPGPGFGTPGQRQVCLQPDGGRRDRLSGLFGDTWLTCEVSGPPSEPASALDSRADAWCVQVANATNTSR